MYPPGWTWQSMIKIQATFLLGFLLNFASGLLLHRSCNPIQNYALGSQKRQNFDYCLCSSCREQFFQIYFIFNASIGGYDVSPPYLFCRPGVKIMLWGVQTLKILTFNLKTIAFREFCLNMSFSYFWVSYNIGKLLTCSSLHS